jgi:RNA polymerase sigma-54 factor
VLDDQFGDNYRSRRQDGELDGKMAAMANAAARGESLHTQLLSQWSLADVDDRHRQTGEHLIGFVDDDGYIRADVETILGQAPPGVTPEQLEEAWPVVQQTLEPAGIGARNLQECMLIQIDALERENPDIDLGVERLLVNDYLGDIEQNRLPRIAESTGLTIDEVKAGLEGLRHLDPRPGRQLVSESPSVVIPDAIVEYDDEADDYVCMLFDGRLPRLRINPRYASMLKDDSVDKATKEFVDSNVRNARWLIEAIDLRSNTLLRVIRVVVAHQRDFFDEGPTALKPLPMSQVAEQLGVHVATISRAVSGKWIQTPRGVLQLRKFFSSGTETDTGEDMSWDAVKQNLKEIIDGENKQEPLGDDKLAAALKERGISIARRTVAKYRDQMGIPAAKMRKIF